MTNVSTVTPGLHQHLRKFLRLRSSTITHPSWRRFANRAFGTGPGKGDESKEKMFFHVSPSGDWWTGTSIFAAKHLQPDYVRSIPIPPGFEPNLIFGDDDDDDGDHSDGDNHQITSGSSKRGTITNQKKNNKQQIRIKLSWEEKQNLLYSIYDKGEIPAQLLADSSLGEKD
mmetsp:Transcript_41436/g.70953  ORF Transcript_41436/g.70953 Transcript_41436/m.70953 type:complete len:171 (+) Transcript_41436:45-557(+)